MLFAILMQVFLVLKSTIVACLVIIPRLWTMPYLGGASTIPGGLYLS